jgi:hypothetical protein
MIASKKSTFWRLIALRHTGKKASFILLDFTIDKKMVVQYSTET